MAKTYRVAVIGRTGKGNYGHGLDVVWKAIENVEIVAVADDDAKGRAAAVERLKAKNGYADYRQMLAKERPQIVSVADRWLDRHRDMVAACAEYGASIFLEKPFCRSLDEADAMVTVCERHHVKLAIAHQTRYSPRLRRVRELIAQGHLGDLIEMRGRGKEDSRGGGQDLMVLGTHIMDLMRYVAGDPRWCFARVTQDGHPATKKDVREGGEGMGPIAGDRIVAEYGFDKGVVGTFGTQRARHGAGKRFGLHLYGSKGIITLTTGSLPPVYFLDDPSWSPGRSKAAWQEITSEGLGKPEPLKDASAAAANVWIAKDLIEAIEKDRQPLGSMYDGRAALEMILAVYESHRRKGPVEFPLENRKHPLTLL
ncbi:MAG TPA: Gfo/Idh/MocA family oxidoreductase [Gemmataceae bacterium]|nr:Gfo/Idh/MocA family oxidoreductase [Gemmataceae bacterium]